MLRRLPVGSPWCWALCAAVAGASLVVVEPHLRGHYVAPQGYALEHNGIKRELERARPADTPRFAFQDDGAWQFEVPLDRAAAQAWRRGALPLWTPDIGLGMPVLATGMAGALNPLKLPVWAWDTSAAYDVYVFAKLVVAGLLAFGWLAAVTGNSTAALLGALAWPACGYNASYAAFHHDPIAWMPGLLWAIEAVRAHPSPRSAAGLALAGALVAVGGHPGLVALSGLAAGLYAALRWGAGHAGRARWGWGAAGGVLALALSAPVWLGLVELVAHGWSYKLAGNGGLVPENTVERTLPYGLARAVATFLPHWTTAFRGLEGLPGGDGLFAVVGGKPRWSSFLYAYLPWAGAIPLTLALAACTRRHTWRTPAPWWLLAGAAVAYGGPLSTLAGSLPGVQAILPRYFAAWVTAGILWLACEELAGLLGPKDAPLHRWAGAALGYGALVALAWALTHPLPPRAAISAVATGCVALAIAAVAVGRQHPVRAGALVLAACVVEFAAADRHLHDAPAWSPPSRKAVAAALGGPLQRGDRVLALGDTIWPNTAPSYGLADPQTLAAIVPRRYRLFMAAAEPRLGELYPNAARAARPRPLFRLAGVQRILVPARWKFGRGAPNVVHEGRAVRALRDPGALPRAWVAAAARRAASATAAMTAAAADPAEAARRPLLEAPPRVVASMAAAGRASADAARAAPPCPARVVELSPERVEVDVSLCPAGGVLVLADVFYPGWSARVDGAAATVYPANGAFRAVAVGPRARTVVFEYRAPLVRAGFGVAGAAALGTLWLLAAARIRRRRLPAC